MNCSPPGSSVCGISQARTQEWITISFSRGPFWPRDQTCISSVSCFGRRAILPLSHEGVPFCLYAKYMNIYSITNLIDINLSKLREIVEVREDWRAALHRVTETETTKRFSNKYMCVCVCVCVFIFQRYDILLRETFHYLLPNLLTQTEV